MALSLIDVALPRYSNTIVLVPVVLLLRIVPSPFSLTCVRSTIVYYHLQYRSIVPKLLTKGRFLSCC